MCINNAGESGCHARHSEVTHTDRRRACEVRNSIQISQVQKRQRGKEGSLPPRLVNVEPLEKATLNATLFADLAPAKAAVCLHQTGQKGGLGPVSQAACHDTGTRDTGPGTTCKQQALPTGHWHDRLQKHMHPRADTYSFWREAEKCMESATRVPRGQLWGGGIRAQASGRHETSPPSSN